MLIIDLVKTVYRDLKKKKLMADKLEADRAIQVLQDKKKRLQAEYEAL